MCFICVRLECVMTVFVWGIHFGFSPKNKKKQNCESRNQIGNNQQLLYYNNKQQVILWSKTYPISLQRASIVINRVVSRCLVHFPGKSRQKIKDLQQRLSLFNSTHTHAIVIENYNKKCFVKLRSEVICQNCTIK